ncbi:LLM class flavin-dependent oxidoreductase [Roseomonas sp. BN140053]|uniref:LLM class flavin-dependent oxidoreductase n=1 Tax=Roseomonas sp. BN140053 TaxID=3391898 RepID=UPI0039E991BC
MKVIIFDLVPYAAELDHLKEGGKELPYPLSGKHFDPAVAATTYEEHLEAWEELDRLGFDGVAFNEHHCSPYGLMNSPNLLAAAAIQRTKRIKLLIYGNLLPLHEPLRLAEELAMLDCMSRGRIISGFARGIPREYQVHNVPMPDSRPRFEEAFEILLRAWGEEIFSYQGKFWQYKDVSIWPRPFQQPRPPIWMPVTGSKESLEFAGRHNIPITPGVAATPLGLQEDAVRYYAQCLAAAGHRLTPDHLSVASNVYLADSKEQAVRETGPHYLYFNRTLFSHGSFTDTDRQRAGGYVSQNSNDYVRPENMQAAARSRADFRDLTPEMVEQQAQRMPWGNADEVTTKLIERADHLGANTLLVSLNRGVMPHAMFMNQIRRFAKEVLPALQAHEVQPSRALETVPA